MILINNPNINQQLLVVHQQLIGNLQEIHKKFTKKNMLYNFYKITNSVDDKIYIGCTSSDINKRFKQHLRNIDNKKYKKTKLYVHMKNIGILNFKIEFIKEHYCTKNEALKIETELINEYDSIKNGLNTNCYKETKKNIAANNDKLYCELCDKLFNFKSVYKLHLSTIEHNEKVLSM